MTREEAIKIINCYDIGFYDLSGEKIPADKLANAFDMAIEALKAEPVNKDAISREGLLKSWNELSIRGRAEFDQVIMTIPALPSADRPTGKWIDVSGSWCANEECSLCGEIVHEYNYNYCPNCGAKME